MLTRDQPVATGALRLRQLPSAAGVRDLGVCGT